MTTTLLLDVDGVLQFLRPGAERLFRWNVSYGAFEWELMSDPVEALTIVGQADPLPLLERILARRVCGTPGVVRVRAPQATRTT